MVKCTSDVLSVTVNGLVRFRLKFIYAHISSEPGLIFFVALAGTEKQIDGGGGCRFAVLPFGYRLRVTAKNAHFKS